MGIAADPSMHLYSWQDKITFLNHGAFGSTLRSAMDVAQVSEHEKIIEQ